MSEISTDFEGDFLAGMNHYLSGKELNEEALIKNSDAFIRGFRARSLEDELEGKLQENNQ